MSVITALLDSAEDISLYSRLTAASSVNGNGSFMTLADISGKGGLLACKLGGGAITYELKITIDGAVWAWMSNSLNSGYVGGILDLDDSTYASPLYTRIPRSPTSGGAMPNSFLTTPNQGATAAVAGTLIIRHPITFKTSMKIEAKWASGVNGSYEIHGYYK